MDLFELFREKQIRITPESQVTIKYITSGSASDLFSLAEGDLLLVKRQISHEDLMLLNEHAGHCTVFTTPPLSLDEFDALEQLRKIAEVHQLEAVGLNYLHYGKTIKKSPLIMNVENRGVLNTQAGRKFSKNRKKPCLDHNDPAGLAAC